MTVFITGGVRNTGLAAAKKFAGAGYDVALTSRNASDAERTAETLKDTYGVTARGYGLDLADTADIGRVFDRFAEDFGTLDTFVACAADLGVGVDIFTATPERFDALMNVNVRGNYFCCARAAELMAGRGAIVLVGSVHAKACVKGRSAYSMSKGALSALTRALAVELGDMGIRVNSVTVGAVHTDRWDALDEARIAEKRANYPVGVESYPEDIAEAVFYLGTDLSRTVTGSELTVDSGILACLLRK